ncbi:hypothetical protein TNCV_80611 [Trichonephila clavipes]|nr:hypothetical protein TNCV_80611 [Trichonephila clavipes]
MLDGNHFRKRLRFIVKRMKELRERFRKEYLGQLVQRHRQDPQSSTLSTSDFQELLNTPADSSMKTLDNDVNLPQVSRFDREIKRPKRI